MSCSSYEGVMLEHRVCNICLSSDRKLQAMKNMVITQDWIDIGLNVQYGKLCWECKAFLNKVSCFKSKALLAQQVFKLKLEPRSLSTLNYRFHNTKDYFYKIHMSSENNIETSQIVQKEIKEESIIEDDQYEVGGDFDEIDIKENDLNVKQENNVDIPPQSKIIQHEEDDNFKNSNNYIVCTLTEEEVLNQRDREKTMIQYLKTNFKCETCIIPFRTLQNYATHMVDFHNKDIGQFVCGLCACRFSSQPLLDVHTRSHKVQYRCGICQHRYYYRDLQQMKAHMRNSHSADYTCDVCELEFNSRSTYRYHKRTQHKSKEHCDECGKMTSNLKIHKEIHNKKLTEECPICHKFLKSRTSLRFHMMTHTKPNKDEAYCAECDVYFKSKHIYKSHLKNSTRHVKADKECDYCHKLFISKFTLSKHIKVVHFNKLDHVCHLCGKKFSISGHLRNHIQVLHEGIAKPRKHVCELCGKGFAIKKLLDDHVNSHTGARPYKCDKCPAHFGFKSALYMHNRLKHLKLKKCGKTATDDQLKKGT